MGDARELMQAALAPSTWRGMESVHRRFLQFRRMLDVLSPTETPTALLLFITRLLRRGDISIPSALTYVNSLVSAERRVGNDLQGSIVIKDLRRALRRLGANKPAKQAVPATSAEVHAVVGRSTDGAVAMAVLVAWRSGARVGDVVRLRPQDVTFTPGGAKISWWITKSDPFHMGALSAIALSARETAELRAMAGCAREKLFPTTFGSVGRALRRENPELSCHSLRRGALTELLRGGVGLNEIRQFSGHSSESALLRYLPMAELSHVRELLQISQRLCC
ncbi:hypothetical protein DIPPA_02380 [Diplonema papillatum]|nr:hypothetical protein DIPPA_07709 [Diplonema papillatum]KAJ9440717.1 hypothetical protein DIPPA_02380 [Diplonema papillatum]